MGAAATAPVSRQHAIRKGVIDVAIDSRRQHGVFAPLRKNPSAHPIHPVRHPAIPPTLGRAGIRRSPVTNASAKAGLRVHARPALTHGRRISSTSAFRKN
jgi:hypothetical protein